MSQKLLDQIFVQWLIEKKGAYFNEQGELCVAGKVFSADDYNNMIKESLTLRATDAEDSAPSQTESNADNLSTSDGSAVPTRRS